MGESRESAFSRISDAKIISGGWVAPVVKATEERADAVEEAIQQGVAAQGPATPQRLMTSQQPNNNRCGQTSG
jgi:hypothetical protein